jgi:putative intracellular protease/amidase
MRTISIFSVVVILVAILSFSSQALGQSSPKVLMIPREGYSQNLDLMIKMEVGVMKTLLNEAKLEVDIATSSGVSILGPTEKIEKVLQLSQIKLDNYVGVIMPCMAVGLFPGPPVSPEAIAIVKKALLDGKPVAAPIGSATILAEAGVLKGRKYAFARDPLKKTPTQNITDPRFEGGIYSGPGVVQDGKIITSGACAYIERLYGLQDGTVELTKKFIAAIGSK